MWQILYCKMSGWFSKFERIHKKNLMILYQFRQNVQISWGQRSQFRGCWQDEWVEKCGFQTNLTCLLTPIQQPIAQKMCWSFGCDRSIPTTLRNTLLVEERPDFCACVGATGGLILKMGDESKTSLAIIEEPYGIHRTLSAPTNLHLPEHLGSCSLSQCEECNQMQIPPFHCRAQQEGRCAASNTICQLMCT